MSFSLSLNAFQEPRGMMRILQFVCYYYFFFLLIFIKFTFPFFFFTRRLDFRFWPYVPLQRPWMLRSRSAQHVAPHLPPKPIRFFIRLTTNSLFVHSLQVRFQFTWTSCQTPSSLWQPESCRCSTVCSSVWSMRTPMICIATRVNCRWPTLWSQRFWQFSGCLEVLHLQTEPQRCAKHRTSNIYLRCVWMSAQQ